MNLFELEFKRVLEEDMAAGDGGVFGGGDSFGHGGAFGTTDFYAPGDYRTPMYLGAVVRRRKPKRKKATKRRATKRKSTKRKKRKVVKSSYIPIQRRTFAPLLVNMSGMQGPSLKRNHGSV